MQKPKNGAPVSGVSRRSFMKGVGVGALAATTVADGATATPGRTQSPVVGPGPVSITLSVNGKDRPVRVEPRVTLLDALRNRLDLTGAKKVCDRATCGACTVLLDGNAVYGCTVLAIEAQGRKIETVEGLAPDGELAALQRSFVENDAQQCGFCTPGFVVACTATLNKNPDATLEEAQRGCGGNLCRCGTYAGMNQALLDAAKAMKGDA